MSLLQGAGRIPRRHLRERRPHVVRGQVGQTDRSEIGKQRLQRIVVGLDRLGRQAGQAVSQPIDHGLLEGVTVWRRYPGIEFGMESPQLVPDLGLGLGADLLAAPLPVRAEAKRNHTTPAARTALVVLAVTAIARVVEVDGVLAVPPAPSLRHAGSVTLGSRFGSRLRYDPVACGS